MPIQETIDDVIGVNDSGVGQTYEYAGLSGVGHGDYSGHGTGIDSASGISDGSGDSDNFEVEDLEGMIATVECTVSEYEDGTGVDDDFHEDYDYNEFF